MATRRAVARSAACLSQRSSLGRLGPFRDSPAAVARQRAGWQWTARCPIELTTSRAQASRRLYSQESNPGDTRPASKIWDFNNLKELSQESERKVLIIDVREPSELRATGFVPGAINIPVTSAPDSFFIPDEEFEDRFGFARPSPDAEIVFYCKAGVRSRAAAELAKSAGWTKVGEYPGSWLDWEKNGGEVERVKLPDDKNDQ